MGSCCSGCGFPYNRRLLDEAFLRTSQLRGTRTGKLTALMRRFVSFEVLEWAAQWTKANGERISLRMEGLRLCLCTGVWVGAVQRTKKMSPEYFISRASIPETSSITDKKKERGYFNDKEVNYNYIHTLHKSSWFPGDENLDDRTYTTWKVLQKHPLAAFPVSFNSASILFSFLAFHFGSDPFCRIRFTRLTREIYNFMRLSCWHQTDQSWIDCKCNQRV